MQLKAKLRKEYNNMKKEILMKLLLGISLILTILSLALHNEITLISATFLIAICIIISFVKKP